MLFTDFSHSDLRAIRPQVMEENRKFCAVWSVVNVVFWVYCLVMSFSNPFYHKCRAIYAVALAVTAATLFLSVYAAPKRPGLIRPAAIVVDEVLLLAGILIARNLAPQTIVVFAAVLIVPVFFITDTLSTLVLLAVNIVVWILVGSRGMEPETYGWVLSNLCIFSVIGIMLGHFVNKARFERFIFAESKAQLAEVQSRYAHYDQLTSLKNRRACTEVLDRLAKKLPDGCRVVAADLNGLKETNDTLGHHAGDEMIIGAAECFRRSFKGIDSIFRTGGDEFTVIITDGGYDVEGALERLKKYSAEWESKDITGISISAGVASAKEFSNIDEMLKAADARMYGSKRDYYLSIGKDRRRR